MLAAIVYRVECPHPRVLRLAVFFFQAEDGIRDYKVTGVQTCALPIFPPRGTDLGRTGGHGAGTADICEGCGRPQLGSDVRGLDSRDHRSPIVERALDLLGERSKARDARLRPRTSRASLAHGPHATAVD